MHSHCNMSLEDGTAVWGFLGSIIWGAVLFRGNQVCRHAGQPLDISSSMYSRSAMVVISFLSILGNSRLIRRSSSPSSFVTWYSSVRVLILSLFITCSSRFSLYTSQLSWQGMTGEFGVACRMFCCVTVFLGRVLICGHWYRWPVLGLSLIHIWRCRRSYACRSRWSPYH